MSFTYFLYNLSVLIREYRASSISTEKITAPVSISTQWFSLTAPACVRVSTVCLWRNFRTVLFSPFRNTPWFFPVSTFSLNDIAAAPRPEKSICRGLNSRSTSPESNSIPSRILAGTEDMTMRNSSKRVEERPSGSL